MEDFSISPTEAASTLSPSVNLGARYVSKIFYILIGVVGCMGNLFVIVVMFYSKRLRKAVTNLLIINQSALDFTASILIILHAYIRDSFIPTISTNVGREMFCRIWLTNMFVWGIFVSSTYNLVTITFERYFAIVYPMQVTRRLTRRKGYVIMVVVWVFGLGFNAAFMIPTAAIRNGSCTVYAIWPSDLVQHAVGVTVIVVQFFIPLALIIFAYIHILLVLKHSDCANNHREQKITRARTNVVKTLIIVCVCFILCWISNQIYYLMYNLGYDKIDFTSVFYHFTVIAVNLNCCVNPFIYSIKYVHFQKAAKKLLHDVKKHCPCRRFKNAEGPSVFYIGTSQQVGQITDGTVFSSTMGSDMDRV